MADFKWYLNRQGIQGRKGDKGEQGFSPIISEGTNDADEYTLLVTNENNTFETPNLRGNFVINDDGVNSTVLYDRENNQLRTGEPVQATTEQLGAMVIASPEDFEIINGNGKAVTVDNLVDNFTKIVGSSDGTVTIAQDEETSKIDLKAKGVEIDDNVVAEDKTWSSFNIMSVVEDAAIMFTQTLNNKMTAISGELDKTNQNVTTNTNNITELQQEVTNTQGDVAALDADVSTLNSVVESHTGSITAINDNISELNTNKVSKTELTEELTKKQNSLVAGDNITIVNNEDGTATISSAGGSGEAPVNMVTTDTDQLITGLKTFTQDTGSYKNTITIGRTTSSERNGLHFNAVNSPQNWGIDSKGDTASSLYFSGFGNGVYFSNAIYDKNGNEILGGATGDVTAAGDNTFTGTNTFNSGVKSSSIATDEFFNSTEIKNIRDLELIDGRTLKIRNPYVSFAPVHKRLELPDGSMYPTNIGDVLIQGSSITLDCGDLSASITEVKNGIFDGNGNRILSQGNVTAGDNIAIEKTDTGIKITSTASGGAAIDDANISTTTVYSSDKTVNLATSLVDNAMTTLNQAKQDTLVSGTNIKTINGQSILGEGDITVGGSANIIDDSVASDTTTYSSNKITNLTSDLINNAIDGQWVGANLILFSQKTWEVGNNKVTYNLNDIIPNDGYNYEVLVSGDGNTGATNGSQLGCYVKSSILPNYSTVLYRCQTRASSSVCGGGSCIIPIGSDHTVSFNMYVDTSATGNTYGYIMAYRRLGKNQ